MIEIKDISFGYGGKLNSVFKDFSLTIEPGRIYGLLGKNGTGKSTLLYLIAGLLRPFKGEVTVDGIAPQLRLPETLQDMFIVPEEFELPKMTLEQAKVLINAPILKVRSMQEIKDECFGPKKTKFSLRLLWIFIISFVVSIPVGIFLHNNQYQVEPQFGFSWQLATLIFFGMWFGISLLIDLFEHHSRVYIKR